MLCSRGKEKLAWKSRMYVDADSDAGIFIIMYMRT